MLRKLKDAYYDKAASEDEYLTTIEDAVQDFEIDDDREVKDRDKFKYPDPEIIPRVGQAIVESVVTYGAERRVLNQRNTSRVLLLQPIFIHSWI